MNSHLYFGSVAKTYHQVRPGYPDTILDRLHEYAIGNVTRGNKYRALDVGCGTGISTQLLAARGWDATGADIDCRMLDVATKQYPHVRFVQTAASTLSEHFDEGEFDLVTAFASAHWFPKDTDLRQVRRVLKPGGAFCIVNRHTAPGDTFVAVARAVMSGYVDVVPKPRKRCIAFRPELLCKRAGFVCAKGVELQRHVDQLTPENAALLVTTQSQFGAIAKERRAAALQHLRNAFRDLAGCSNTVERVSRVVLVCVSRPLV